ncbi:hypothetical protein L915_15184 [Phytophthora nicotianae]|uniref:Uncharacterized protein n=1 Tax=Phytophthora nicotianae TaxID=4792 RepID=W2G7B3_PHYNI|nr:hypothetical protein L915_15184 [Phytophthora nicotianae]
MEVLLLSTDSNSPFALDSAKVAKKTTLLRVADKKSDRTCTRCGKVLATSLALQNHQNKVFLCDQKGVRNAKRDVKVTSIFHRCRRCEKTFSSAAGLRYHIAKAVPCEARQTFGLKRPLQLKRSNNVTKLLKPVTSSSLDLSQPKLRVNSGPEQLDQGSKTAKLSKSDKALRSKISLDEYLSVLKENQRQPKQKPPVTRPAVSRDSKSTISASNSLIKRKRIAGDKREMSPMRESNKRVCSEPFTTLAAQISKSSSSPDSLPSKPINATTTSAISSQERKPVQVHGGNILTDGCCCRQCVRKWTCNMMNRLEYLNDEVTSLRKLVRPDQTTKPATTKLPPASAESNIKVKSDVACGDTTKKQSDQASLHSRNDQPRRTLTKTNKEPLVVSTCTSSVNNVDGVDLDSPAANDSVAIKLIEKYNRLNYQIITNERALEDSVAYLKETPRDAQTSSSEVYSQLDELRVYIDIEKSKRDEAVAAVIAQQWNNRKDEFRLLLETMTVKSKLSAQKAFHEECVEITSQLGEKIKILSTINTRESSHGVDAKYAVERTAKQYLERQRDDIFMCMIRTSPRIHLLTKAKLDETTKKM